MDENKVARLTFAKQYIDYPFETTIFVDESVFAVGESEYGWSRIGTRIHREKSKYLPTARVFGAISMFGKLILAFYSGNLDQYAYQKLLSEHLYPYVNLLWGHRVWVLLQDGATCHRAKSTLNAILKEAGDIIDWSALSPDLNPIEHVWSMLKTGVARRNPRNEAELRNAITQEWELLDNDIVISIARSMPKRLRI